MPPMSYYLSIIMISVVVMICSSPTWSSSAFTTSFICWSTCALCQHKSALFPSCQWGRSHLRPRSRRISLRVRVALASSRALPYVEPLRDAVHAPTGTHEQPNRNREHLRNGRSSAVQCRGVGKEHTLLPRPSGHRPGSSVEAQLE